MRVVIIGSGNVAAALGDKILEAGHRIVQVAGRNGMTVLRLANQWQCGGTTDWNTVDLDGDIYVVALADSVLPGLGKVLSLPGKLVLHTAGALPADTLVDVSPRAGVLYPLQSFSSATLAPTKFPLLIDSVRPEDLPIIRVFAETLTRQVVQADDSVRLKLHVAAVLVNNFTNHLYTLAADFCRQEHIDFSLLLPLIRETAQRVENHPPQDVQTGPALRGDRATLQKHAKMIANYTDINKLYSLFTTLIEEYCRSGENPRP
jgi:predicted short-subunit dehydrogenase-like oxidoreductase (DUF2520 family)